MARLLHLLQLREGLPLADLRSPLALHRPALRLLVPRAPHQQGEGRRCLHSQGLAPLRELLRSLLLEWLLLAVLLPRPRLVLQGQVGAESRELSSDLYPSTESIPKV